MKKCYFLFTLCLVANVLVIAAPRYWVGPSDGNWNNSNNWSATNGGAGGASVPGAQDSVVINRSALINMDVSTTINSLVIGRFPNTNLAVRLYTSIPITFTVRNVLEINFTSSLKDSTSSDVPFNFVFNGATSATGLIYGQWILEGGVPVGPGNGPTFSAPPGSLVRVLSELPATPPAAARITLKNNTSDISSTQETLQFRVGTFFDLDNNPGGAIPNASWDGDAINPRFLPQQILQFPGATISITGSITGKLRHLATGIVYPRVTVDLSSQTADASLALRSGSLVRGDLTIQNTNNHTLTLLADTAASGMVEVELGTASNAMGFGGYLAINGANTRVALARAAAQAPSTSYLLKIHKGFNQSAGNFSLQDSHEATGSSTLSLRYDLIQTGGSFITNSTATNAEAKFVVAMDDPPFIPDQSGIAFTHKVIRMSSGSIDNGRGMVTLRINHSVYSFPSRPDLLNGVSLESPLTVGRLELTKGPLTTTASNVLTIMDPDITTSVKIGASGTGYVNGPLRRHTNSTNEYVFPTGKGNTSVASLVFDSCIVIPVSAGPSFYQAEYFKTGYEDTFNVQPPLAGVSRSEYWHITKLSGADARVKLALNGSVPNASNKDVLTAARYSNSEWVRVKGNDLSPGDALTGAVVSAPLSVYGPFTFGFYPYEVGPPLFLNCPADTIVSTDPSNCTALLKFNVESSTESPIIFKVGSSLITSPYAFPKGTTVVDVTASDYTSAVTCSFRVMVVDREAPVISDAVVNPANLLPVDNQLKNIYVEYTVTDNCGQASTTLSVTSNQPQTGTDADWEIVDNHNVRLRAKKSAEDRIYTISVNSTDEAGNHSMKSVSLTVPKWANPVKTRLEARIAPNPTRTYFNLYVKSNNDKQVTLQVYDLFGRIIETRRFFADATIRFGDNYRPGIYFVRLTQAKMEIYMTLLKLP